MENNKAVVIRQSGITTPPDAGPNAAKVRRRAALEALAPDALAVAREILRTKPRTDAEKRIRADMAKTVLDRVGLGAQTKPDKAEDKPLEELTVAELERMLQARKRQAAADAKPVIDGACAPSGAPDDAQAIDILG